MSKPDKASTPTVAEAPAQTAKPVKPRKLHKPLKHFLSADHDPEMREQLRGIKQRTRRGASHVEAQCPGCGAMRPGFCLSYHPTLGLRCDGCISAARRETAVDEFEEETPDRHEDGGTNG